MISDEVEERMQTTNFMRDTVRGVRLRALNEEMQKDARTRIQYAAKYASSANYWKNAIGMNEGLVKLKVLNRKRNSRKDFLSSDVKPETMLIARLMRPSARLLPNATTRFIISRLSTKH